MRTAILFLTFVVTFEGFMLMHALHAIAKELRELNRQLKASEFVHTENHF